jgi:hypothetical protein
MTKATTSGPRHLKPNQVPFYYPVFSRSQVYVHIGAGHFKTKMLRLPGNVRGTRVVFTESIEAYINSCSEK